MSDLVISSFSFSFQSSDGNYAYDHVGNGSPHFGALLVSLPKSVVPMKGNFNSFSISDDRHDKHVGLGNSS